MHKDGRKIMSIQIAPPELTEREYYLKCRVEVREIGFLDHQSNKTEQVTDKFVFLIPTESSQRDMFFSAWLPDMTEAHHEVAAMIHAPINSPSRLAVMRRNANCKEHHLFVMSLGAEQDLKAMIESSSNNEVTVTIFSEHNDEQADRARMGDLTFDKKQFSNEQIEKALGAKLTS